MSLEQKYAHIKDPDQAALERYQRIVRPGKLNTLRLLVSGLMSGGGPVRPSEMREAAEDEIARLQAKHSDTAGE